MKKLIVFICFIIFSVNQINAQEVKSPDYIVEGNVYSNPNHHISSTGRSQNLHGKIPKELAILFI